MHKKRWLFWIVLAGVAVRLGAWFYFRSHTLALVTYALPDDALYYFTIARNLAHGLGITFDGVHPTNGMHPLWVFVVAPFFWFHLTSWGYIHAVLLLQSLLDVITLWFIGSTVYDLLPEARPSNRVTAAAVAAALYAASAIVTIRAINGLETGVAALLLVVCLRVFLKLTNTISSWVFLGIISGLVLLARTDLFIVLLPISIYTMKRHRAEWLGTVTAISIAFVIVLPWLVWNVYHFGTPLQSSAEAVPILAMRKYNVIYSTPSLKFWHLGLDAIKNALKPFWYAGFGLPLLAIVYRSLTGRKTISEGERTVYYFIGGGVLLLLVHSLFRGFIRDWYVEELLPLLLMGFGVSVGANAGKTEARASGRWTLGALVILFQVMFYTKPQMTSQEAVVFQGVPLIQQLTPKANVAALNSGYYSYFAARTGSIVDLDGVVSAEAVNEIERGDLRGYLDRNSVSYILDFAGDFGGYQNLIDKHMLDDFKAEQIVCLDSLRDPLVLFRRRTTGDTLLPNPK